MAHAGPSATTNAEQVENYCLSKVISAHKADVRSLAITQAGAIISAGRDEYICFWTKKGGEYVATLKIKQPKDMTVNSIAHVETDDGWRLFAGRKDGSIAMYGSGSTDPIQIFREHSSNVCCLFADQRNGILMSGSWDNNVVIWPFNQLSKPEFTALGLRGHTLSVWGLATFPDRPNYYLTASADKTIKLWKNDDEIHTYKGHEDVVRAVVIVSSAHFLSAGNDGFVGFWDVGSGTCLGRFKTKAHDYIYSMALCGSLLLTSGEDGTIEFWGISGTGGDGHALKIKSECVLQTPSLTTWDVAVLPSSDIALAGSDGRIYILSKDRSRVASAEISEAFDAEVVLKLTSQASRKEQSDTIVIKVSLTDDQPANMNLRYKKGTDPAIAAQTFIDEYQLPQSYLPEIVEYICTNIPEANAVRYSFSNSPSNRNKNSNNQAYDSLFKTQIDGRLHEIPYNLGEDVNSIAQRYAEQHNLSIGTMQTIAVSLANELNGQQSAFFDPLTGTGRYIPGGNGNSNNSSGYVDPFTGEGRYVPGQNGPNGNNGFSGDPLTGDGGYRVGDNSGVHIPASSAKRDKLRPIGGYIPQKEFLAIENYSVKASDKLKEINAKQIDFKLEEDEIERLVELLSARPDVDMWTPTIKRAFEMAFQWPIDDLAPVLDFFRSGLLHKGVNSYFCGKGIGVELVNRFIAILVSNPADKAIKVFICRCIANAFLHPAGAALFSSTELNTLAPLVAYELKGSNNAAQSSAAIALLNWSVVLHAQSLSCAQLGPKEDLLKAIINVTETFSSFGHMDPNTIFKIIQTIGTLMWGDAVVAKFAKDRNVSAILARLMDATSVESAKSMARDIIEMTHAV